MKFPEKMKKARKAMRMNQTQLADAMGVSLRTITNYEAGNTYPKKRAIYENMAEILNIDADYLMTDDDSDEFISTAGEKYGNRGANQARDLVDAASVLFAGGELDEEDKDELMRALQNAYWRAKEYNRKYSFDDK